ncbi:MAG: response regulator [Phormidesmis sp. RL_2_1]|nr:response regulator [Phormidesmis sp. RL_2_1]
MPFIMLQQELAWQSAQQEWQIWEQAGLSKFSPDWAPVITHIEVLQAQTPPQTFQTLTTFVDGDNTLRDLAIKFKQPIIPLAKSILPYVSRQMLGLTEIPDIIENAYEGFHPELIENIPANFGQSTEAAPEAATDQLFQNAMPLANPKPSAALLPVETHHVSTNIVPQASVSQASINLSRGKTQPRRRVKNNAPRIIYIDDSPSDSRAMAEIVESVGFQYTNIPDPLQALPALIELKPKLIFLDLVMPIANGYEVCSQIRRISAFQDTPVIIVTSNDGIADRVRAKLVGASGFLGKPIQHKKVLKVLKKHIREMPSNSVSQSGGTLSPI